MSRPKKRKGGRVTPKGTGSTRRPAPDGSSAPTPFGSFVNGPLTGPWDDDLDDDVVEGVPGAIGVAGDAIASGHPVELLVLTSTLADAADDPADEDITWSSVVELFTGTVRPETTALLHALRPFAPDDWRTRIDAELARRSTPGLPDWIARIADVRVTGVWVNRDEATEFADDDETDVFLVATWPTGQEMTFIANVVGQPNAVVGDALLAPVDLAAMSGAVATEADEPLELVAVDAADARAFLDAAAQRWDESSGEASEDWPSGRPLLRWLLSTLPVGGEDRWTAAEG